MNELENRWAKLSVFVLVLLFVLVLVVSCSFSLLSTAANSGWRKVASLRLPLDGSWVMLGPLKDLSKHHYKVVVSNSLHFGYDGKDYDALSRTKQGDPYVEWSPSNLKLVEKDAARHRYVFLVPNEAELSGKSIGVRVNIAKFVDEFIIPPSEVQSNLSGAMNVELWVMPLGTGLLSGWILGLGISALFWIAVITFLWKRRQMVRQLETDIAAQLARIQQKYNTVLRIIPKNDPDFITLTEQLTELHASSRLLAEHLQAFRQTEREVGGVRVADEIRRLEKALSETTSPEVRKEYEVALAAQRKLAEELETIRSNQSRYWLRLSRIEAMFDSVRLKVEQMKAKQVSALKVESLTEEIGFELHLLDEVNRELAQAVALKTTAQPDDRPPTDSKREIPIDLE